jgi:homoisocitrate dehydrogenase
MVEICVIEGDGIGKEVIPAALAVLKAALPEIKAIHAEAGWECFLKHGVSVPEETLTAIRSCGAALFGAVSSPSRKVDSYRSAIITMRQELDLYANIRPIRSLPRVSPRQDVNLVLVRENTEGLYVGREQLEGDTAIAERVITRNASRRIGLRALEILRMTGKNRLTIVHKANILPVTDGLFRDSVRAAVEEARQPGEIFQIDELLVDTAAYQLVSQPEKMEVMVTTNLFGDILSDAASHWGGGMGLAPSLNWGVQAAIAEPVHGSAPDIAGKGIANPIAAILSTAMLARYVWKQTDIADRIENAVHSALAQDLPVQNYQIINSTTESITQAIIRYL